MQSVQPTFCRTASPACGPTRAIVCYVRGLKAALAIKRCAHRSHRLHAMLLEISLQHGLRLGRHLLDRPAEPAGIRTHRAPERLRARLPAVCDLWEWVDVGTHGVRERHERRRVPDASPLATEVPQRLSACPPTHALHSQSTIRPSGPDGSTYPADSSTAKPASVSSSSAAASVSSGSSISARSAWQRAVRRREARQGRPCALSSARHVFRFRLRYSKPRARAACAAAAAAAAGIPAEPGPTSGSSRRSASPHSR